MLSSSSVDVPDSKSKFDGGILVTLVVSPLEIGGGEVGRCRGSVGGGGGG